MNNRISSISRNNRSNRSDGYKNNTKKMVVILVGMIRVLVGIVS